MKERKKSKENGRLSSGNYKFSFHLLFISINTTFVLNFIHEKRFLKKKKPIEFLLILIPLILVFFLVLLFLNCSIDTYKSAQNPLPYHCTMWFSPEISKQIVQILLFRHEFHMYSYSHLITINRFQLTYAEYFEKSACSHKTIKHSQIYYYYYYYRMS